MRCGDKPLFGPAPLVMPGKRSGSGQVPDGFSAVGTAAPVAVQVVEDSKAPKANWLKKRRRVGSS